jgi:hypothetical protein
MACSLLNPSTRQCLTTVAVGAWQVEVGVDSVSSMDSKPSYRVAYKLLPVTTLFILECLVNGCPEVVYTQLVAIPDRHDW